MYMKVVVLWLLLGLSAANEENLAWDLAVAVGDQVQLLTTDGDLVGNAIQEFDFLKALAFDSIRHRFLVSNMYDQNDTIIAVKLTNETEISPLVEDLPDDILGLAVDPINDTLYWSDVKNGTINYVSLKDPFLTSNVLIYFEDETPRSIALDVCRGYIYWTNSNPDNPSIERLSLDTNLKETIISDDLNDPLGITVDYLTQRIYWTDRRTGIYYRIESANFDGKERQIVHEGTYQTPVSIAVNKNAVYWTDIKSNALWSKAKNGAGVALQKVKEFSGKEPYGLVAKNLEITSMPDCKGLADAIKEYKEFAEESIETNDILSSTEIVQTTTPMQEVICLNNGQITVTGCKCKRGFSGANCETSVCYNYCVHGSCHHSRIGHPVCDCPAGYTGSRCEQEVCDGYCLNGGVCEANSEGEAAPKCSCPTGFEGSRCELNLEPNELCSKFCKSDDDGVLMMNNLLCRCQQGTYSLASADFSTEVAPLSAAAASATTSQLSAHFQDTAFIILLCCIFIMMIIIVVLSAMLCRVKRIRPRIKKRIIVSKNVTPLTDRPTQSEQCEITIENCCNMNVCETPCFETPTLRSFSNRQDEKKNLLANMETGGDEAY